MLAALAALLPVLLFLGLLVVLDSFKLVKRSGVALALVSGAAAALAALPILSAVDAVLHVSTTTLVRYVGPVVEESLKLVPIGVLLHRRRVGFPVDAAVLGFAVGAGFALVENVVYLRTLTDTSIVV